MTKIIVAYAPDTNVLPITLVSMASILKNARKHDEIEFVIMYAAGHLEDKYAQMLDNLKSIKNYTLNMVKIDEKIFDGFPCSKWGINEAWFRSLLADLLPNEEKVLYLDCDTLVKNSLDELFKIDLEDNLVGVVEDAVKSKENAERIALSDFYFNSGVLLINLKAWRKTDFFNKLKNIVMTDAKISNEYDALNKACEGLKHLLPPKYDYLHIWWNKNKPQYDEKYMKEYLKAEENPVIVHFTGANPDASGCKNKFVAEFWEYAKLVPAYDALKREICNTKDNKTSRPFWKRIFVKK